MASPTPNPSSGGWNFPTPWKIVGVSGSRLELIDANGLVFLLAAKADRLIFERIVNDANSHADLLEAAQRIVSESCATDTYCTWCGSNAPGEETAEKKRYGGWRIVGPIPHNQYCAFIALRSAIATAEPAKGEGAR